MVIGIIGESCTGKSTLAAKLQPALQACVYSGKDYLRLAKNEQEAVTMFRNILLDAMEGGHIIYVVAEREQLSLLPQDALRILMTADLEIIQKRFAQRMHGNLPVPVAAMLQRKHGCFDDVQCAIHVQGENFDPDEVCNAVLRKIV